MKRLLVIGAVSASMLAGTGAIAYAAGSGSGSAQPTGKHVAHAAAPVDTTTESKFTAISPCRAVDTRTSGGGGAYADGTQRTYDLAARCGVPSAATAVSATLTTVASKSGYLKAWASGSSEPSTSFMNYGTAFNASTGGVIPVGNANIVVKNHAGPTQVIVDITGYYIKPLRALVNANGTFNTAGSSRVTNSSHDSGSGVYTIQFDRDVSNCTYAATTYTNNDNSIIAEPFFLDAHAVFVTTRNATAVADMQFYLTVTC